MSISKVKGELPCAFILIPVNQFNMVNNYFNIRLGFIVSFLKNIFIFDIWHLTLFCTP